MIWKVQPGIVMVEVFHKVPGLLATVRRLIPNYLTKERRGGAPAGIRTRVHGSRGRYT